MQVPARRLAAFYFCYFAILGALLPFWSLYLQDRGFNPGEIGELSALLVATRIVAPHLWGWLADRSGRRLQLVRLTTLLAALLFAGFLLPASFLHYALVTLAFSFFWNAALPQFEAATLAHLKACPQRYSRIRLWGSVGFICAVLGIGHFLDLFSIAWLPAIVLAMLTLNWLVALSVPETPATPGRQAAASLWGILRRREVMAFFAVYLLLQIAHGPYYVFYTVYLTQHGHAAGMVSMLWALAVCAEILMFLGFAHLLRLFSPRMLLLASLALSTLRWLVIARQAESLPLLAAAQLLHAASFGVTHVVAMQLLHQYFGDQHLGKAQAFYSSVSFGIGGMLGSLYSGYFWDSLGGAAIFTVAAAASALALVIAAFGVGRRAYC